MKPQKPTCQACRLRAAHGTCTDPKASGLAERFILVWPPAGHAEQCPAFQPTPTFARRLEAATA